MNTDKNMRVLGIETSCDETGIAIYDTNHGLLAHELYSQIDLHAPFGGVVPELASRDHLKKIAPLLDQTLKSANLTLKALDGIAYTKGPGLVGALLVGAMFGRTLGFSLNLPCIGVHHLEGHLLAAFLEDTDLCFPFLALLVSGGHTELVNVKALGDYTILGETLDDAVGEAFDKTAKLLGLPYPGGAQLAALAKKGTADRFQFPRPMIDRPGLDFSFSGLKTVALRTVKAHEPLDEQTKADIAYAFQAAIVDTLAIKCQRALKQTGYKSLVIAGGVGANESLRAQLSHLCDALGGKCYFPTPQFCTDNGAMIAYAGAQRLLHGAADELSVDVKPRWPLNEVSKLASTF